jgi:hypothetical protein
VPRRRLIDPDFWESPVIGKLTRDERHLLLGCVGHADDEGRLNGNPSYLKSSIFMYDKDLFDENVEKIKSSLLDQMQKWEHGNQWILLPYQNSEVEYLFFPNWNIQQKPSHPTPSKLPAPPPETFVNFSGKPPEIIRNDSGAFLPQSSLGQSSLGKDSLGKGGSGKISEDFTKFSNEKDLTDYLTTTLKNYAPRGGMWLCSVLKEFWWQCGRAKMPGTIGQLTADAVKQYPLEVVARAYVKAVKYTEGKTSPVNYLKKILEEKGGKLEGDHE